MTGLIQSSTPWSIAGWRVLPVPVQLQLLVQALVLLQLQLLVLLPVPMPSCTCLAPRMRAHSSKALIRRMAVIPLRRAGSIKME